MLRRLGFRTNTLRKISSLKKKASKALLAYRAILALSPAGEELTVYMSGSLARLKKEFNDTMDQLQEIDPTCPKTRL